MNNLKLTDAQKAQYEKDGYLIVKNFVTPEEAQLLYNIATGDDVMKGKAFDFNDQKMYTPGPGSP